MTNTNISNAIKAATKETTYPTFNPKHGEEFIEASKRKKEAARDENLWKSSIISEAEFLFGEYRAQGGEKQTMRANFPEGNVDVTFRTSRGEVQDIELAEQLGLKVEMQRKVEMRDEFATPENLEKLIKLIGQKRFAEWFSIAEKQVVDEELSLSRFEEDPTLINKAVKFSSPSVSFKAVKKK